MKTAVASIFITSLAAVTAFAPSQNVFIRKQTTLNLSPAEFAQSEIEAHDVS